jgi:hypothetical protein
MMSSGISIDVTSSPLRPGKDEGFRPWHFFVLASILLATVAVVLARKGSPEHLILLSVTIAAAGAAAGAFYRMLAPLVSPSTLRTAEPLNERTRAALVREKTLVLRSIKELEFDRAMGKLSQKDFDEMSARLRSRALVLMKQLDVRPAAYAQTIEHELQTRLSSSAPEPKDRVDRAEARMASDCLSCKASNDPDAIFCKKCGTRLQA